MISEWTMKVYQWKENGKKCRRPSPKLNEIWFNSISDEKTNGKHKMNLFYCYGTTQIVWFWNNFTINRIKFPISFLYLFMFFDIPIRCENYFANFIKHFHSNWFIEKHLNHSVQKKKTYRNDWRKCFHQPLNN